MNATWIGWDLGNMLFAAILISLFIVYMSTVFLGLFQCGKYVFAKDEKRPLHKEKMDGFIRFSNRVVAVVLVVVILFLLYDLSNLLLAC
ncbi:MAG: hypothetical protein AAGK14_11610 [Verrucomicrobiota bacterium]